MNSSLQGRVALVTGGTSGIGLASARELAERGAKVFVTGRRQAALDAAVRAIGHGAVGIRVADDGKIKLLRESLDTLAASRAFSQD